MNMLDKVKQIAEQAHAGRFRHDGVTPYIEHPKAVAANFDAIRDPICHLAAWLHDVVEDSDITIADLIAQGVPIRVCEIVQLLTRQKEDDYLTYLLAIKQSGIRDAIWVKLEDMRHNMMTLDIKKHKTQFDKYRLAEHILAY